VLLGLSSAATGADVHGFRPARHVTAPTVAYEIQQHEVTWSEFEAWAASAPDAGAPVARPAWVPAAPAERARWPVTNVSWSAAMAYCRALGGSLPTKEEWELAARGAERRPFAWGAQPLDRTRTHAYAGADARTVAVMSSEQDATPGDDERSVIYDLMGNAREWTADLFRDDLPDQPEGWTQAAGRAFRAVRGLPLAQDAPLAMQLEPAAYRNALCASGPCPPATAQQTQYVGFRCARRAGAAAGAPR
jgi:formylglycine-generating enzyme required for sulfatase activity